VLCRRRPSTQLRTRDIFSRVSQEARLFLVILCILRDRRIWRFRLVSRSDVPRSLAEGEGRALSQAEWLHMKVRGIKLYITHLESSNGDMSSP
jgi:hypothetical protein